MSKEKKDIEDVIAKDGFYVTHPKGTSMLPLIYQGHDTAIIIPKGKRLEKYDVALYRRKSGEYVLHRVVKVKKDSYVMCGDNQHVYEHGVTDDMVIGIMTELFHDGESVDIQSKKYKKYAKRRVASIPYRRLKAETVKKLLKLRDKNK